MDVSKVRFRSHTGPVIQRNKRRATIESSRLEVPLNGMVTARVPVLRHEPTVDLHSRVALLAGRRFVRRENGVNDRLNWAEDSGGSGLSEGVGLGLGVFEGFTYGVSSDAKLLGDLSGAQPFAVELSNPGEIGRRSIVDPENWTTSRTPLVGRMIVVGQGERE